MCRSRPLTDNRVHVTDLRSGIAPNVECARHAGIAIERIASRGWRSYCHHRCHRHRAIDALGAPARQPGQGNLVDLLSNGQSIFPL
jgi:hypothetical protein